MIIDGRVALAPPALAEVGDIVVNVGIAVVVVAVVVVAIAVVVVVVVVVVNGASGAEVDSIIVISPVVVDGVVVVDVVVEDVVTLFGGGLIAHTAWTEATYL